MRKRPLYIKLIGMKIIILYYWNTQIVYLGSNIQVSFIFITKNSIQVFIFIHIPLIIQQKHLRNKEWVSFLLMMTFTPVLIFLNYLITSSANAFNGHGVNRGRTSPLNHWQFNIQGKLGLGFEVPKWTFRVEV